MPGMPVKTLENRSVFRNKCYHCYHKNFTCVSPCTAHSTDQDSSECGPSIHQLFPLFQSAGRGNTGAHVCMASDVLGSVHRSMQ